MEPTLFQCLKIDWVDDNNVKRAITLDSELLKELIECNDVGISPVFDIKVSMKLNTITEIKAYWIE